MIVQFISYDYSGNVIENELIELSKLKLKSVESYECIVDNGIGDVLRKIVTIYFSGKTFVNSSDLTASQYHIESHTMCGAIDSAKYTYFYFKFLVTLTTAIIFALLLMFRLSLCL